MLNLQICQILTMSKSDQSGAWAWTWSRTQVLCPIICMEVLL